MARVCMCVFLHLQVFVCTTKPTYQEEPSGHPGRHGQSRRSTGLWTEHTLHSSDSLNSWPPVPPLAQNGRTQTTDPAREREGQL